MKLDIRSKTNQEVSKAQLNLILEESLRFNSILNEVGLKCEVILKFEK